MLPSLKLLLPALIPSWRFFDIIAPSPRIEFALLRSPQGSADHWQEFRSRPAQLPLGEMPRRLFWNPQWNETLFLVSCAERMIENPNEHSHQEILSRIKADLKRNNPDAARTNYLQFRLVFISRHETEIQKEIFYTSPIHICNENPSS